MEHVEGTLRTVPTQLLAKAGRLKASSDSDARDVATELIALNEVIVAYLQEEKRKDQAK